MALKDELEKALRDRRPVIEVVAVAGTTEEGAVDPIEVIASIRDEMAARGLAFSLHCDAAYGGYFAACFRTSTGEFRLSVRHAGRVRQLAIGGRCTPDSGHWGMSIPSRSIRTSSGTSPILRERSCSGTGGPRSSLRSRRPTLWGVVNQNSAAELNLESTFSRAPNLVRPLAAVFLCHRVVPLNERGYGRLLGETVRAARSFYRRLTRFAEEVKADFRIHPLVFPDTNIINYLVNPSRKQTTGR